jgi:hypothetical protein
MPATRKKQLLFCSSLVRRYYLNIYYVGGMNRQLACFLSFFPKIRDNREDCDINISAFSVLIAQLVDMFRLAGLQITTRQMRVEFRIAKQKYKPTSQSCKVFPPLTDLFYIFGQLFSDLASDKAELLANLAGVLKTLFTPLPYKLTHIIL